jgi:DNA-binding transcriptional ArsR family regulator
MMESDAVIRALAALAQPHRLSAFRALVVAGPQGMTPSTMAEGLQIAPATLSFHLKELLVAGLVTQSREGRHLIYRAEFDRMNELLSFLTANCCAGRVCAVSETTAPCQC